VHILSLVIAHLACMFQDPTDKSHFNLQTCPWTFHNQHWVKCTQNKGGTHALPYTIQIQVCSIKKGDHIRHTSPLYMLVGEPQWERTYYFGCQDECLLKLLKCFLIINFLKWFSSKSWICTYMLVTIHEHFI
jgi:hypothetical protein